MFLDPPSKPYSVRRTINSITIGWKSLSLHNVTYTVQFRHDDLWMGAKCDTESLVSNLCTVRGTAARVTGLKHNTVYHFRVSASYKGIKSDFSQPSDALRTTGDVESTNSVSVLLYYKLSASTFYLKFLLFLKEAFQS